jgi:hypothetical protein
MKTAEEFLKNKVYITQDDIEDVHDSLSNVKECMIEFAKLHVQEALKAADEKAIVTVVDYEFELEPPTLIWGVDSDSILNAYPLDKIK